MGWSISKREKFVLASVVVTTMFLLEQLIGPGERVNHWYILSLVSVAAVVWSLWGNWEGIKMLPLLVLPLAFPLGMLFISTLLTNNWLTAVHVAIFGISYYILLLIENIYAVSAIRTIPLIRAAHTIGFLFTLVTIWLILHTISSFHLSVWLNGGLAFLVAFPLSMQSLWAVKLEESISDAILIRAFVCSVIIGEIAWTLSFWPAASGMKALVLTTAMYTLLGVFHHEIQDKWRTRYATEYVLLASAVLALFLFTTSWRG